MKLTNEEKQFIEQRRKDKADKEKADNKEKVNLRIRCIAAMVGHLTEEEDMLCNEVTFYGYWEIDALTTSYSRDLRRHTKYFNERGESLGVRKIPYIKEVFSTDVWQPHLPLEEFEKWKHELFINVVAAWKFTGRVARSGLAQDDGGGERITITDMVATTMPEYKRPGDDND